MKHESFKKVYDKSGSSIQSLQDSPSFQEFCEKSSKSKAGWMNMSSLGSGRPHSFSNATVLLRWTINYIQNIIHKELRIICISIKLGAMNYNGLVKIIHWGCPTSVSHALLQWPQKPRLYFWGNKNVLLWMAIVWFGGSMVWFHGMVLVWGAVWSGERFCGHRWPTCSVPPAKTAVDAISGNTGKYRQCKIAPKLHWSHVLSRQQDPTKWEF